jgi:hypothetical protein
MTMYTVSYIDSFEFSSFKIKLISTDKNSNEIWFISCSDNYDNYVSNNYEIGMNHGGEIISYINSFRPLTVSELVKMKNHIEKYRNRLNS